jgi:hypothetical protein
VGLLPPDGGSHGIEEEIGKENRRGILEKNIGEEYL